MFAITLFILSLSTATAQLCGTTTNLIRLDDDTCESSASLNWTSCCSTMDDCRMTELVPPGSPACTGNDNTTLALNLKFDVSEDSVGPCCKTCGTWGDPEGYSFDNQYDKFILCDARTPDCRVGRSECDKLTDHNGNKCVWLNGKRKTSRGYDFAVQGSPCVPDLTQGPAPSMLMLDIPGVLRIDLELGERAVIRRAMFTDSVGFVHTFDAERCFTEEGPFGASSPPLGDIELVDGFENVSRKYVIRYGEIYMRILCYRNVKSRKRVGVARLNIQDVIVPNHLRTNEDSGFCATGVMDRVGEENPKTTYLHQHCVQNVSSALQACKHLIDSGSTPVELEFCAIQYCHGASLPAAVREDCLESLVPVNDYEFVYQTKSGLEVASRQWELFYCKALYHLGKVSSVGECRNEVNSEGWLYALTTWGTGLTRDEARSAPRCEDPSADINDYAVGNREPCETGAYVDVYVGGVWVPAYFFPDTVCGGAYNFDITGEQAPSLFNGPIRVRQCNGVDESICPVDRCRGAPGVEVDVSYVSLENRLIQLYNEGRLCECTDNECKKIE